MLAQSAIIIDDIDRTFSARVEHGGPQSAINALAAKWLQGWRVKAAGAAGSGRRKSSRLPHPGTDVSPLSSIAVS
jgi:hypothetical protein